MTLQRIWFSQDLLPQVQSRPFTTDSVKTFYHRCSQDLLPQVQSRPFTTDSVIT